MLIRVWTTVRRRWIHDNRAHGPMVRGDPDNTMKKGTPTHLRDCLTPAGSEHAIPCGQIHLQE